MVEGENGDLGPGIPASLAQHLQEHGVHCRVLEQDGKVVTSDHKYCCGDDGCDVGRARETLTRPFLMTYMYFPVSSSRKITSFL